jgi:hypothetical protein
MRMLIRGAVVGLGCVGLAVLAVVVLVQPELVGSPGAGRSRGRSASFARPDASRTPVPPPAEESGIPLYGDGFIDDSGYTLSTAYTGEIADRGSIEQVREATRTRVDRGIQTILDEIAERRLDPPPSLFDAAELCQRQIWLGALELSRGEFARAVPWLEKAYRTASLPGLPREPRANIEALLGVAALRRGELENCVACLGPSSCILPIAAEARHQFPDGSREAIRHFTAYLDERPDDLGVRWVLNLAAMTLGEYPNGVPPRFRLPLERGASRLDVGRFANVAQAAGLGTRGANMAGGSIFDDFNGDGLPDLFLCSFDVDLGAALYINKGDGTFEDQASAWGLSNHVLALNCSAGDYDNDGRLDVLLLRGGWENSAPLTLLRHAGGHFEDVTAAAGLAEPIASQSAAWGDYDNDGDLDILVAGEYLETPTGGLFADPKALTQNDARNRCRLYRNNGDGTFTNVAEPAGVTNDRYAKGVAWGDYDDDGWLDAYVSNMGGPNRLYHNNGDGTFDDRAEPLGAAGPTNSFACWFWDYDNDGRLDLFVCGYQAFLTDYVADLLGQPRRPGVELPRLYRNLGPEGFRDMTAEAGLDRVYLPMGANFGDIDNDGYLDIYLSTGRPSYAFLVPNVLLKNVGGRRFEDVSIRSGTAHLQKGHGVSFADYDGDGDLDLFAELGGAVPGDRAHNALFQNPGHGRHWLAVKVVGTKANRLALGAKLKVDIEASDGTTHTVHRTIGGNSSYGGNRLVEHVGLGGGVRVRELSVVWPGTGTRQTFRNPPIDQMIQITENEHTIKSALIEHAR